ncbi:MAG: zinc-ribbon domain-containing protein [Clostridiales bacterium]|nr:zinc-ribbon domain-containing protein [Clostridiales bacterium]
MNCGSKMSEEAKCPDCDETIIKGSKFCLSCGKRLSNACPNCSVELAPGAKFCIECGTKI